MQGSGKRRRAETLMGFRFDSSMPLPPSRFFPLDEKVLRATFEFWGSTVPLLLGKRCRINQISLHICRSFNCEFWHRQTWDLRVKFPELSWLINCKIKKYNRTLYSYNFFFWKAHCIYIIDFGVVRTFLFNNYNSAYIFKLYSLY